MEQYGLIRTLFRIYNKNISEISRETGHSRNTIRKALKSEMWGYKKREKQPFPVLGEYLDIIEKWLKDDKEVHVKQRHTARRIYNRLVDEYGYGGSESAVRKYVRETKARIGVNKTGVFIPGDPEVATEAEADWGTTYAIIKGVKKKLKYFCMRSKYSGKPFARAYPCERQQAFFDAHNHAFRFYGGIFRVIIYDNLSSAVYKVRGKDRIEQKSFNKFRHYYNYEAKFANVNSGNEKGGVEGIVGFVRRNFMVPTPEFDSLEEFNDHLLQSCIAYGSHKISGREESVNVLFEREKTELLTIPDTEFNVSQIRNGKIDKYSTVTIDRNRYSVPTSYAGMKVSIILNVNTVEIFVRSRLIAKHERLYNNSKWQINPDHYLELLQQRPRAFDSSRPIRQWKEKWPKSFDSLLTRFRATHGENRGIKDFINVLLLHREYSQTEIEIAVELAVEHNISSSEGVKHLLLFAKENIKMVNPINNWNSFPAPNLMQYEKLGE